MTTFLADPTRQAAACTTHEGSVRDAGAFTVVDDLAAVLGDVMPEDHATLACAANVLSSIVSRHDRDLTEWLLSPEPARREMAIRLIHPWNARRHLDALLRVLATSTDERVLREVSRVLDNILLGGGVSIVEPRVCTGPTDRDRYLKWFSDQIAERSLEARRAEYLDMLTTSTLDALEKANTGDALATYLELSLSGDSAAPFLMKVLVVAGANPACSDQAFDAMYTLATPTLGPKRGVMGTPVGKEAKVADVRDVQALLAEGHSIKKVRRDRAVTYLGAPSVARCQYTIAEGDLATAYWASIVLEPQCGPPSIPWPGDLTVMAGEDPRAPYALLILRSRTAQLRSAN